MVPEPSGMHHQPLVFTPFSMKIAIFTQKRDFSAQVGSLPRGERPREPDAEGLKRLARTLAPPNMPPRRGWNFVWGVVLQICRAHGAGIHAFPICQPPLFPVAIPPGQA
jgi:hypothetical protein